MINEYCCYCGKPKEGEEETCTFCGFDIFTERTEKMKQYSLIQWEFFIGKRGPVGVHDFSPWEFSEDGTINRGGISGSCGSAGIHSKDKVKKLHAKKNAYNKK